MFEGISYHLQYLMRSIVAVCGRRRRWKEGLGEYCLCFYHWCICSLLSSTGLTRGNKIVKIVVRSQSASETHCIFCFLTRMVLWRGWLEVLWSDNYWSPSVIILEHPVFVSQIRYWAYLTMGTSCLLWMTSHIEQADCLNSHAVLQCCSVTQNSESFIKVKPSCCIFLYLFMWDIQRICKISCNKSTFLLPAIMMLPTHCVSHGHLSVFSHLIVG